jgi:hypothetical protein
VERAEKAQIERVINHNLKERFAAGAVQRAVLLEYGEDPAIEPGQLMVRVFVPAPEEPADYEQVLADWQEAHRAGMDEMRRLLSLRLPSARLLEFTFEDPGDATPRITMPDDGSLAAEQMSGREIVTTALALLRANYVFPEVAERAATAVEARLAAGEYDNLDEITLTELVTRHLQEVTGDKHLRLALGGGPPPGRERPSEPDEPKNHEARRLAMRQRGRLDNFGIRRVERLDGNVGYLDLRRVAMPANAGPAIAAAMELVAGTYALILDLRHNGGGVPDGVALWCSYLLAEEPTHLNDIFHADTGARTFSGGEELCYNLQALGRAELIGETTGGGAHPTRPFPISGAVHIGIPFARSVNPVTGTNWEGIGVTPDVAVPEAEAYDVAYGKALRHILDLEDVPPPIEHEARDALTGLESRG